MPNTKSVRSLSLSFRLAARAAPRAPAVVLTRKEHAKLAELLVQRGSTPSRIVSLRSTVGGGTELIKALAGVIESASERARGLTTESAGRAITGDELLAHGIIAGLVAAHDDLFGGAEPCDGNVRRWVSLLAWLEENETRSPVVAFAVDAARATARAIATPGRGRLDLELASNLLDAAEGHLGLHGVRWLADSFTDRALARYPACLVGLISNDERRLAESRRHERAERRRAVPEAA